MTLKTHAVQLNFLQTGCSMRAACRRRGYGQKVWPCAYYASGGSAPRGVGRRGHVGETDSFYALRLGGALREDPDFAFQEETEDGRMIVVGDADFIRNNVRPVEGGMAPLPLGWDRYSQRVIYDNKEWLLNAMSYLLDDAAQISLRSRSIAFRPLDDQRIRGRESGWRLAAVGIPVLLVVLLGLILPMLRRKRWTSMLTRG